MKKLIVLFSLILISAVKSTAQQSRTDKKLKEKIESAIANYSGDIGVYVKDLKTGRVVAINADTIFPTASIVKVPILVGVMSRINKGELGYDSSLVYTDSLFYSDADILGSFKSGATIPVKKLIMLMLTTSDNTASLWLQSLAGGGASINETMQGLGLENTRVNSRTPGRENNKAKYGWGQTTPREMGTLFEMIYNKKVIGDAESVRMQRCLGRNFWDQEEAISRFPPTIEVFSKNGCVDASRSEAMIVNAKKHPFVFCVFTKNNKDRSWNYNNEAWTLARKLADILWARYGGNKLGEAK